MYRDIKGYIYHLKGDDERAEKQLLEVLSDKNYEYSWAHFHLGLIYWKRKELAKALSRFQIALALEDKNPYAAILRQRLQKWIIQVKKDMYEDELGSIHVFDHDDVKRAA